jgi:hypothetical protein
LPLKRKDGTNVPPFRHANRYFFIAS